MFKRSIVIGGMIAGAFLLPNVASAGKVKGACVNCHTMHNSQNNNPVYGAANSGRPTLLAADCVGCHSGGINDATGKNSVVGSIPAPQISDTTNILSGGYFNGTTDNTHHNVYDFNTTTPDVDVPLGDTPPGGAALTAMLSCSACHQGSGGHHGTAGGYRLLVGVTGTPSATYGVNMAATEGVGKRSDNQYTPSMNTFCASCHTLFHGTANQESATTPGTWIRHPTDISMAGAGTSIVVGYDNTTDTDVVPVGTNGTADDVVLCLSCHVPHGSANADLLSFTYGGSGSYAGDSDATGKGCETCHSYSGAGM